MKYWLSIMGVTLGALSLLLAPHHGIAVPAYASSATPPAIESYSPDHYFFSKFRGEYLSLTGQGWMNFVGPLNVFLFDPATLTRTELELLSYAPEPGRMVVQIPTYVGLSHGGHNYDLYVIARDGTRTIISNAITVLDDSIVAPPSAGETVTPEVAPLIKPAISSTDIVRDAVASPVVSNYTQVGTWSGSNRPLIVVQGTNWPTSMYGLDAFLIGHNTDTYIALETVSYAPESGRMVVQLTNFSVGNINEMYDLVVMTTNGVRTTIRNAIQRIA